MDSQILHLFAKPEVAEKGLAGLSGHTVYLGPAGSGVRCVAGEILKYAGLAADKDFVEDPRSYDAADEVVGRHDARRGFLPLAAAFAYRRQAGAAVRLPTRGAADGPGDGAAQAVLRGRGGPHRYLRRDARGPVAAVAHGRRPRMLIANAAVPSLAVERLLEVLCESDFYPRVNLKKMDPALIQRAGDYPFHPARGPTCTAATPGSSRSC